MLAVASPTASTRRNKNSFTRITAPSTTKVPGEGDACGVMISRIAMITMQIAEPINISATKAVAIDSAFP